MKFICFEQKGFCTSHLDRTPVCSWQPAAEVQSAEEERVAAEYLPTSTDEDGEETEARHNDMVQSRNAITAERYAFKLCTKNLVEK